MSIMRGDKVILVKEHDKMKMVGAIVEVGNITETFVVLRNPKTKVAIAAVSIDEFYDYFKSELNNWTSWTELMMVDGVHSQTIGWYRTNHKKVQVKLNNGVRAEATCNKTDQFNLYLGVNLAVNRCNKKILKNVITNTENQLEELKTELKEMKIEYNNIDINIKNLINRAKPIEKDTNTNNDNTQGT